MDKEKSVIPFSYGTKAARLVWEDDFNLGAVDEKNWTRCSRGNSDWNRHMSKREDLVSVEDGCLVLWGKKNEDLASDERPFLTGGVLSMDKVSLCPGQRVEIKAKLESHAKGAWPALWLLPQGGAKWPWGGEIDILERLNSDPFVYQTVHSGWTIHGDPALEPGKYPVQGQRYPVDFSLWNVYGLEILEDMLVWTVNGKTAFTYPKAATSEHQWPFTGPMFLLMDMQLGGGWVGDVDVETLPVRMFIDWVRIYGE